MDDVIDDAKGEFRRIELLTGTSRVRSARRSVRPDQAVGLVLGKVTGNLRADVVLEAADGRTSQRTENAVHGALVVIEAMQCFLDLPSVCFGRTGLGGLGYRRRG